MDERGQTRGGLCGGAGGIEAPFCVTGSSSWRPIRLRRRLRRRLQRQSGRRSRLRCNSSQPPVLPPSWIPCKKLLQNPANFPTQLQKLIQSNCTAAGITAEIAAHFAAEVGGEVGGVIELASRLPNHCDPTSGRFKILHGIETTSSPISGLLCLCGLIVRNATVGGAKKILMRYIL